MPAQSTTETQPSIDELYAEIQKAQGKTPSQPAPAQSHDVVQPQHESVDELASQVEKAQSKQVSDTQGEIDVIDKTNQLRDSAAQKAKEGQDNAWATLPWYDRISASAVAEAKRSLTYLTTAGENTAGWIAEHSPDFIANGLQHVRNTLSKNPLFATSYMLADKLANANEAWSLPTYEKSVDTLKHLNGWAGTIGRTIGDAPSYVIGDGMGGMVSDAVNLGRAADFFFKPIMGALMVPDDPKNIEHNVEGAAAFSIGGRVLGAAARKAFPFFARMYRGVADWRLNKAVEKARNAPVKLHADEPPVDAPVEPSKTPEAQPTPSPTEQPKPTEGDQAAPAKEPTKPQVNLTPEQVAKVADYVVGQEYDKADKILGANAKYIDWSGVKNADDVEKILNDTTAGLQDSGAAGKWNEVQPTAETERLAKTLGIDPEYIHELYSETSRDGGLAPRVYGAMRVMLGSANHLRDLAKTAVRTESPEDYRAFLEHVHRHSVIQAEVAGIKRQVARSLRSMQIMQHPDLDFANLLDEGGVNRARLKVIAKKMSSTDNLSEMNARSKFISKHGLGDAFLEVYINGLLSSPKTIVTNVLSNATKVLTEAAAHTFAAGYGAVRQSIYSQFGKDIEAFSASQVAHMWLHGTSQGLWDALKVSRKGAEAALQAGRKAIEPSNLPWKWDWKAAKDVMSQNEEEFGTVWRALAKDEPITDSQQKVEFGAHHVIQSDPNLMDFRFRKSVRWVAKKLGVSEAHVKNALDKPMGNAGRGVAHLINLTGNTLRLPGRLLVTGDELFKTMAIQQAKHSLAYKAATDMLVGSRGDAKAVSKMMQEMISSPRFDEQAIEFARQQTFQEQGGRLAVALRHLVNSWKPLRFIMPFVKTPTNIIRQSLEHTPAAIFMKTPRADGVATWLLHDIAKGGPEGDLALGRLTVGSLAMYAAYKLHEDGLLTGHGPSDPRARAAWLASGHLPGAVKFGDEWVQLNRLDPMASWLFSVADVADAMKYDIDPRTGQEDKSIGAVFAHIGLAGAKNFTSKTWMSGFSRFLDAMDNPDRDAKSYLLQTLPSMFIPFSSDMRQVRREEDPYMRETQTLVEAFRNSIPGKSTEDAVKRDVLGRPIKYNGTLGPEWLSPLAVSPASKDRVDQALWEMRQGLSTPQKDLGGIPLTSQQYSDYLKLRGQDIKIGDKNFEQWFTDFVNSDEYKRLSKGNLEFAGEAQSVVHTYLEAYATMAKQELFKKYPKLKQEYEAEQQRKIQALIGATQQ